MQDRLVALLYHLDRDIGIPSGMIFLPGDKLEVDGYKWAPKTWMYEQSQYFLYPLFAKDARTAFLTRRGLHVQYSDIEIHADERARITARRNSLTYGVKRQSVKRVDSVMVSTFWLNRCHKCLRRL